VNPEIPIGQESVVDGMVFVMTTKARGYLTIKMREGEQKLKVILGGAGSHHMWIFGDAILELEPEDVVCIEIAYTGHNDMTGRNQFPPEEAYYPGAADMDYYPSPTRQSVLDIDALGGHIPKGQRPAQAPPPPRPPRPHPRYTDGFAGRAHMQYPTSSRYGRI
jgi:hypothetical protein